MNHRSLGLAVNPHETGENAEGSPSLQDETRVKRRGFGDEDKMTAVMVLEVELTGLCLIRAKYGRILRALSDVPRFRLGNFLLTKAMVWRRQSLWLSAIHLISMFIE